MTVFVDQLEVIQCLNSITLKKEVAGISIYLNFISNKLLECWKRNNFGFQSKKESDGVFRPTCPFEICCKNEKKRKKRIMSGYITHTPHISIGRLSEK